jgi:hypothetical protein
VSSVAFGLFVFVFLAVFKPFGLSIVEEGLLLQVSGYGVMSAVVLILAFVIGKPIHKRFSKTEYWTIKHIIVLAVIEFLVIASCNWAYTTYIFPHGISYLHFIFITFAVGIMPTVIFLMLIERFLSQRNTSEAQLLTDKLDDYRTVVPVPTQQSDALKLKDGNSDWKLQYDHLILVKAEGNYVKIYYEQEDGSIDSRLIKTSMNNIANRIAHKPMIKQCHRSYIVNFYKVGKITGNARNFNLHIDHMDFSVPVSRSFPKEFIRTLPVYTS